MSKNKSTNLEKFTWEPGDIEVLDDKEHKIIITIKGGGGSGNFGHQGRPGKVGGSGPGTGMLPFDPRPGISMSEQMARLTGKLGMAMTQKYTFDEDAERATVMENNQVKAGMTRDQAARFFHRRDAVEAAKKLVYRDRTNAKGVIDDLVKEGYIKHKRKGNNAMELTNGNVTVSFRHKAEIDYIKVIFDLDNLAKNY